LSFEIDFEPIGKRVPSDGGTILDAAQRGGIVLNATCGGEGVCGRCLVRVMAGDVSEVTSSEEFEINEDALAYGWRLACQAKAESGLRIHIPPDSLATAQRTQTEGQHLPIELNPAVTSMNVVLEPPSLEDLRSDADRIRDALGISDLVFHQEVLKTLSEDIRAFDYKISVFINGSSVVGVRPEGTPALGLAVDLGTTKLAGYLIDLTSADTLATAGAMNPQIAFGEDVMSRIGHAIHAMDGRQQLQSAIIEELNTLAADLCAQAEKSIQDIADAVIVGNTAMHHLFLGLPVKQLGLAPYVAAENKAVYVDAVDLGLEFSPGAKVYSMPNIAGFVGADHVAMLLGSGMLDFGGNVLGLDIGTNTEISLIAEGKHFACSTASGPAFEGAHVEHGMRAAPGAIEKVLFHDGEILLQTIGEESPVGICGSGILDVVAQLRKSEIITMRGSFSKDNHNERVQKGFHGDEFVLVSASENRERQITFNRSDINQIQLAKGAMRTGVDILLDKDGLTAKDLDAVIIAGAFGTYLDIESGIEIGMFPDIPRDKFHQMGNAAGAGARMGLLSLEKREQAAKIAKNVEYVELTVEPSFSQIFARNLQLEKA
jgi:uncharacterized 2Fe-2S/4Fe-4S cluster protein (DUF4445 family)